MDTRRLLSRSCSCSSAPPPPSPPPPPLPFCFFFFFFFLFFCCCCLPHLFYRSIFILRLWPLASMCAPRSTRATKFPLLEASERLDAHLSERLGVKIPPVRYHSSMSTASTHTQPWRTKPFLVSSLKRWSGTFLNWSLGVRKAGAQCSILPSFRCSWSF